MNKGIHFEKVSFTQWQKDMMRLGYIDGISESYNNIVVPRRATFGSAGYDIRVPLGFTLHGNEHQIIPTGLRCVMPADVVLMLFPRSGLGFRYGVRLMNTVGVIDSDYAFADNEGHILLSLRKEVYDGHYKEFQAGDAVCQAVFLPFFTTDDDNASGARTGGFGSTGE